MATAHASKAATQDGLLDPAGAARAGVLPQIVITAAEEIGEVRAFDAGATVAAVGQLDASEFYVVESGVLRAARHDPANGAMVIENHGPGRAFGLAAAMAFDPAADPTDEDPWGEAFTLTVEDDASLLVVDSEAFRGVVAERPAVVQALMRHFAQQARDGARATAADASPDRRVYAALLDQAVLEGGAWRIAKMPKHRELADVAGVDESAAAAAVATAIADGVARREYPGLVIEDIEMLKRLSS